MSLYTDIAFGRRTQLTQDELNKRQKIIADAIEALRAFVPDWESQVAALAAVGLERINEALLPAYQQIIEVSNLGALFSATSVSSVEIGLGTKTFVVEETQRLNFAPTPYLMAYAGGSYGNSMVGILSSYDNETGVLVIEVADTNGTGTFDDWDIGPIATTDDLEALRDAVEAVQVDVTAKKNVVDTKHAEVVAVGALYYGARNTAPVGAALGSQYLDTSTTPNLVKVLTGTGWAPTVTVSVGGRRTQDYVAATAGQTGPFAVDGGFSTGDVYVNGVLLRAGSEVTLNPGSTGTFTLAEGLAAGDLVSFRGFLANDATDIYTKAEANALLAAKSDVGHGHAISDVAGLSGALDNRLRFDVAQSKSTAERGQARANIGAGVLAGFRNKLINPGFSIAQRGNTVNLAAGVTGYTLDRWFVRQLAGQSCVATRLVQSLGATPDDTHYGRWVFSGTGAGLPSIRQRIESVRTLAGKRVTVRARIGSDVSRPINVYIRQNFGNGGSPSAPVDTLVGQYSGSAGFGDEFIASVVLPSIVGKTLGSNGDDHLELFFESSSTGPQTIFLAHVSLVEGDATAEDDPFSPRHPQQEMALCQRYYQTLTGLRGLIRQYNAAFASVGGAITFPVRMWTIPSVVLTTPVVTWEGTGPTIGSVAGSNATTQSFGPIWNVTGGALGTTGSVAFDATLDAEIY